MRYVESVEYSLVDGNKTCPHLRIYALSTCAFCEKAMDFLKEHGYPFEYLFFDLIDRELKRNIKTELKQQYKDITLLPLLLLDGKKVASGFVEKDWRELLHIV